MLLTVKVKNDNEAACAVGAETSANIVNPLSVGAASCPSFTLTLCAGVVTALTKWMMMMMKYLSSTFTTLGARDAAVMLKAAAAAAAAETLW